MKVNKNMFEVAKNEEEKELLFILGRSRSYALASLKTGKSEEELKKFMYRMRSRVAAASELQSIKTLNADDA